MSEEYSRRRNLGVRNCLDSDGGENFARDVKHGLMQPQKKIPSKYFYDARGSRLFERICSTPEYYPTRVEKAILDEYGSDIMEFFARSGGDLVELGSGPNGKIRKLLDSVSPSVHRRMRYVPVDICESALLEASEQLLDIYEGLTVHAIAADFTCHLEELPDRRKLITFFGSSIGNFRPDEAVKFLRGVAETMKEEDRFLLGLDMVKPVEHLEAAYNDSDGITGLFNLNILSHLNDALNADFEIDAFEHLAFFNAGEERMEMHLRARRPVVAYISDLDMAVPLEKGETIHTEISCKYSRERASLIFKEAGLEDVRWYTDPEGWFSLVELKRAAEHLPETAS